MNKKVVGLLLGFLVVFGQLRADEGMWPLTLIQKLQDDMQSKGLKLTAEDIYSINKASAKDAVVRLMSKQNRMFCTGEIISEKGLFLTNHHCGYGAIQELSTPEDNILANGFWAKSESEERKANFNIGLLSKVEDITAQVLDSINLNDEEVARAKAVADRLKKLTESLKEQFGAEKGDYVIEIVPFYGGNKYLAMYYHIFTDIRLVGTPPENIGKFGGETDNWEWPRHTCDISVFRIYSNDKNQPAAYNASNKPFKPNHFFPINIQSKKQNDFAMILGYPGRTQRFTYSEGIKYYTSKERPMRVKVRRDILDIYEESMHKDPKIKLMYADKFAGLSNYWKKYLGESTALVKLDIYNRRKDVENRFSSWVKSTNQTAKFGEVIDLYNKSYETLNTYGLYSVYFQDGVSNSQPMVFATSLMKLETLLGDKTKAEEVKKTTEELSKGLDEQYKEYFEPIERKVLASVLMHVTEDLDHAHLPQQFIDLSAKYKKDYTKMANDLYDKSFLTSKEKMAAFLAKPSEKKLKKDMIYVLTAAYLNELNVKMKPIISDVNYKLARAGRLFQAGVLEMDADKVYSPDANGTMRLTYGKILPYNGKDAVSFKEFTTSKGILEKYTPGDIEFDAPVKLIDMMKKKDFGRYADKDGELHTCFLTDNDITGGNSGSPVVNGNGELIGTAFDGNWESISSDFAFEPNLQRTICVDIRYTLFIMDKFGGAGRLINEMKIIE
jgi:hypothetical protein